MNTYPDMNKQIVWLLRMTADENPVTAYAAARIEELEAEWEGLRESLEELASYIGVELEALDFEEEREYEVTCERARAILRELEAQL